MTELVASGRARKGETVRDLRPAASKTGFTSALMLREQRGRGLKMLALSIDCKHEAIAAFV